MNSIVSYTFCMSSTAAEDTDQAGSNHVLLTVYPNGSGYLQIGHALDLLEAEAPGLAKAFFFTLLSSLYRWMRIYDYRDAKDYEEMLRDSIGMDDEEARKQYEFPEVDKAIPTYLTRGLQSKRFPEKMLLKHQHGPFGSWIRHVLAISKHDRGSIPCDCREGIDGEFDQRPLPCWLIVFRQHDAVEACFDEEAQTYYESSAAPSLALRFNPCDPHEVALAFESLRNFMEVNRELCLLRAELHSALDEIDGHRNIDRGESQRRVA